MFDFIADITKFTITSYNKIVILGELTLKPVDLQKYGFCNVNSIEANKVLNWGSHINLTIMEW